jgi:uncharacterized Zn-binding protein involved in type VI secretion
MSEPHIADGEAQFIAYNISPDFCKVGKKVVPFDIVRVLDPQKCDYAVSVFARDEPVLMIDSIVEAVEGDKGKGLGSKVSQGKGHVEIILGSSTVMVESRPVARHDDLCLMNVRVEGAPAAKPKAERRPDETAQGTQNGAAPAAPLPPATADDLKVPKTPQEAPETINLSKMNGTFNELWGKSLPGGKSQEHGGTIVADANGNLAIVNTRGGTKGTFSPDFTVRPGQTVVGVFHTHPYAASEGGHTGISFSGTDAASLVNGSQYHPQYSIDVLQSGEKQFAYLRTEKSPLEVGIGMTQSNHMARYGELRAQGVAPAAASQIAASDTATNLGLAYYEGRNGVLKRVNPP